MLLCRHLPPGSLEQLLESWAIRLSHVAPGDRIPGSHWGEPEAGIVGSTLFVRDDTPVHSALHEAGHLIVMSEERRAVVDTDAGGDELEESAVCVFQIQLAEELEGASAEVVMTDMDEWGYSFRLGSTRRFFEQDSGDARQWLEERGLSFSAAEKHPVANCRVASKVE